LNIGKILTVLVKLKNLGLSNNTIRSYRYRLERIDKHVDLDKPELVSEYISNVKGSNAYKESFVKAYNHYVEIYGLSWDKPRYKYERKIPRIPNKESIEKIIARASRKYARTETQGGGRHARKTERMVVYNRYPSRSHCKRMD